MVIKHRLFEEDKGNCARWDLCKVWSPQMKNMTESHPPRANKCILPIFMLKIQPNNPKDKLQIPKENVETWKTFIKQSLPGDLSQKIVYQDMNKRRSIYNLGFRLTEKKDIDFLHTCKDIYEGEVGVYNCTVPYAPLEYINDDKPPPGNNDPPKEQRQNPRTPAIVKNPPPATSAPGVTPEAAAGGAPAPLTAAPTAAGAATT